MKFALKAVFIYVPIAVILIALSVANRGKVDFSFDPFNAADPWMMLQVPLFWIVFASFGVGLIVGSISTWWRQGRFRKEARNQRFEATKAQHEVQKIKEQTRLVAKGVLPAPKDA